MGFILTFRVRDSQHRNLSMIITQHKRLFRLKEEEEKNKDLIEKETKEISLSMKFYYIQEVMTYILMIFFLSTFIMISSSKLYCLGFEKSLKIISPVVTEKEEKTLVSSWASMSSYEDYKHIKARIEDIAKKNKIKTPKSLI
jgi:hypothetical protein